MTEESKLSLNNVPLHASQIPEFFPEPLKKFLTNQPDFNAEVEQRLEDSQKLAQMLQQELSQMQKQRQDDSRSFTRTLKAMQQRLTQLEGKNHGDN